MRFFVAFVIAFIPVALSNSEYEKWSDLESSFSLSQLFKQKAVGDGIFNSENLELLSNIGAAWKFFKINFKRAYGNVMEETKRFLIFGTNFIKMMEHNRAYQEGKATYKMGVNNFTDKTEYELRKLRGYRSACRIAKPKGSTFISSEHAKLPDRVDWRRNGAVTPVKNQGQCGSCWAFSSTGAIEGQHYRKTNRLVNLSEQQLIDCSKSYGNNGCEGGLMDLAFQYVRDNEGIDSEISYPYISGDGDENVRCLFNSTNIMAQVTGYINIHEGDERALMNAVATIGPVSVAINAGLSSFSMYKSGIYSDPECASASEDLDHGVLLVGYGIEDGKPYWLIKNSWGEDWGDKGYVKILKDSKNMCGVASAASYPLV
uniref:Cathepsin L n=1 Tax=Schistosoma japonicum TaxID=6182 RepID=C1LJC3_SCHJA|nr:Cathepsin L precursor [Schistosoma japonicum]CAX74801.1 Cathepsin L precursor [Schistosoma japonicum]